MKNLWEHLNEIISLLKSSPIKILMFDFDGTLSPIIKSPRHAVLPKKTKDLLQSLSKKNSVFLAIISGRELQNIKEKVNLAGITYGGIHGFEGEIEDKKYLYPVKEAVKTTVIQLQQQLEKLAGNFNGAFVQHKKLMLALHYRSVEKTKITNFKIQFKKILEKYIEDGLISVSAGKMVFEIIPNVDWNKGSFANLVCQEISKLTNRKSVALYIGDDVTDEDVFNRLENGITIRVGKNKTTKAQYYLKNTQEVVKFLQEVNQI